MKLVFFHHTWHQTRHLITISCHPNKMVPILQMGNQGPESKAQMTHVISQLVGLVFLTAKPEPPMLPPTELDPDPDPQG